MAIHVVTGDTYRNVDMLKLGLFVDKSPQSLCCKTEL